ncbi:Uncharacterised protein [Parabacteroides distasonis]|nr:Uncharacterised protein [Parabacteroides distasonis]
MKINNSLKKKNNSVNERSEIKPFTTRVPQGQRLHLFHDYLSTRHLPYSYPYGYILVSEQQKAGIWAGTREYLPGYRPAAIILAYISSGDSESEPPEPPGRPSASLSTQAKVAF